MRKIKEILRLNSEKEFSTRQIGRCCNLSPSTVSDYLARAKLAGLSWPLPENLDDAALEAMLFSEEKQAPRRKDHELDFSYIYQELRRKSVTLQLLWMEYKEQHRDDGYQYSRFCELYQQWRKTTDPVLRQVYKAGEKMLVDYAGPTIPVVDPATGEMQPAYMYVAVLGASNYTYAEPVLSLDLYSWISSHCRAYEFFGGVTEIVVPDNTRTAVKHPCWFEPVINETYLELATHVGTVVIPARPRRGRDKAKVETGVQIVERWIMAPLRNRTFFSLEELAGEVRERLLDLNNRPFQKLDGCRRTLFETLDQPALKPLPAERYEFATWKKAKVNIDYHVDAEHCYYSVPFQLIGKDVDIRVTAGMVEVIFQGQRVALHQRLYKKGAFSTEPGHRPEKHQRYLEWNPQRIISWAESIGLYVAKVVEQILESRPYPEQGYRSCLGIMRLARRYTGVRVDAACRRALAIGSPSYQSVKSILEKGLDQVAEEKIESSPPLRHLNLRGPEYYGEKGGPSC